MLPSALSRSDSFRSVHVGRSYAAMILMGKGGAALIAHGALVSVFGYLSAGMLTGPRYVFALAEQGDFPSSFAAVHPKFRPPHFSILFFAILIWLLALI